jgi:hypothetical protein
MTARRRHFRALHSALFIASVACVGAPGARAQTPAPAWTGITYLSGTSVYLEVGTKDGVRVGTRFEVLRAGSVIATIAAEYVSSSRTACTAPNPAVALAIGDSVRYSPVAPAPSSASAAATTQGTAGAHSRTSTPPPIRGRLGIRYLVLDPGGDVGSVLTQPAFDLRLDGQHLGNTPIGIVVDVRAQRSMFGTPAGGGASTAPTSRTRVYQAALLVNSPGSPRRLTVGRQFATALSTMGIFDGIAFDVDHPRTSYGALAGIEPDASSLGFSTTTREYGAYLQFHNRPAVSPMWTMTLGGVGSYQQGEIDREFAYLRTTYNSRHFSLFAAQELDINRGWKSAREGGSIATPTSTFAIATVSLSDALSLYGGMDNRRNVRLYRDYQNPEITFDDSFRQGVWGGTSLNLFRHLRMSADVRTSSGGTAGDATSYTGSLSVSRITRLQGALHARATRFTGLVSDGRLQSVSAEIHPFGPLRIEFTAGTRTTSHPLDATNATRMDWTGIDADIGISRSLYVMFSTSRETGALDHTHLTYASLSYRF